MTDTLPSDPRQTGRVWGHDREEGVFRAAYASGRLHHAWLLAGPHGIGKATLAFHFARILLGGEDPASAVARRIAAGTHGDLLVIARTLDEKKGRLRSEITAADVRPVQTFLHHTAAEGGWRVVIVDGAEFLNRFAANAMLKILEEPPSRAVLVLTSAVPGALLPTLRSRCRFLALSPLDARAMSALLPALSPQQCERAQGSPGKALFLAKDKDGSIIRLAHDVLNGRSLDTELFVQTERIARGPDGFALVCHCLREGLVEQARRAGNTGRLIDAEHYARRVMTLETLRQQTEQMNLDKIQAIRQAVQIAASG